MSVIRADGENPNDVFREALGWHPRAELLESEDAAALLTRSVSRGRDVPDRIGTPFWMPVAPVFLSDHPEAGPYLDRLTGVIDDLSIALRRPDPGSLADPEAKLSAARRDYDRRNPPSAGSRRSAPGFSR
jgi:hypothetical protein